MTGETMASAGRTRTRPLTAGRVLAVGYGVFVVAAGGRSTVQIATQFDDAPMAYVLSAIAAMMYLAGQTCVVRADRGGGIAAARVAAAIELAGVAGVGVLSLEVDLGDDAVWSAFGRGYGFVPLLLPLATLAWTRGRGR